MSVFFGDGVANSIATIMIGVCNAVFRLVRENSGLQHITNQNTLQNNSFRI